MIFSKQIITSLILISFVMVLFFSFSVMMHQFNKHVYNNCPFPIIGTLLCSTDALVVFHHISAYQSFLSVVMNTHIILLIIFLLSILNVISILPPLTHVIFTSSIYHIPLFSSYKRKITRWFALHEYSPAIY